MGKNKKSRYPNTVVTQAQSISYSGPLPVPEHLARYEQILPGAAERIFKMAEEQSVHRRALESKVINSGVADSKKGLWFGFFIGLSGFFIVGYCAFLGFQILAGIIAALDLGSLVGVFVYGSRQKKIERVEKERAIQ